MVDLRAYYVNEEIYKNNIAIIKKEKIEIEEKF
jgi:hypothetical protein